MASTEYLEEIWSEAKKVMPGWMYATLHMQARSRAGGRAAHRAPEPTAIERLALVYITPESLREIEGKELQSIWKRLGEWHLGALRKKQSPESIILAAKVVCDEIRKRGSEPPISALLEDVEGLTKSKDRVAFVGICPEQSEEVRELFKTKYLEPLGLTKDGFWNFSIIPEVIDVEDIEKKIPDWEEWAIEKVEARQPGIVIALGKTAKRILGDRAAFVLPHPAAIKKFHDSGEVPRKIKRIAKQLAILDKEEKFNKTRKNKTPISNGEYFADSEAGTSAEGESEMFATIAKADDVKRIVYGVVMDPYGANGAKPDAHNDFIPPSTIEDAAHDFMQGDRTIGRQHKEKTNAQVVESWIEMYPDQAEYKKAIEGKDHKVLRREFGTDMVHSGSWIMGVKLGEADWKAYEKGELNAFSPGGVGFRQVIKPDQMPKIQFIDLVRTKTNG
jgi:hypothetical protein